MWIHSIRLKNFKSYDQAIFHFPEPENGKNIVLIGAQNGHGKTTLLEAVYLCLYDKDAISHLQRAGLNSQTKNYIEFLQSALHHHAEMKYGQYCIELEVEIRQIQQGQIQGFRIKRRWYFDAERKLKQSDNQVSIDFSQNGIYELGEKEMLGQYLNIFAVPIDYAPFFFFDGEKIVQTAQQSGTGLWLNMALKGLLGVTLLERLKNSLKKYRSQCISENTSQKIQTELISKERALQLCGDGLEVAKEQLALMQDDWQAWIEKRDSLIQRLGGGGDIRTSQDLVQQREKIEKEMATFEQQVKSAVKAMPLAFLPRQRLKELQTQLNKEKNRLNHEAARSQTEDKVDDFWRTFISNEKVKEVLGKSASMILDDPLMKEAVRECWKDLFYPLPDECANKIEHNYLSVNAHAEIQNEISKLGGMPQVEIGQLLLENARLEAERKQVAVSIELLKGTNNDELVEQLKTATNEADKLKEITGQLKGNVVHQSKQYQKLQKEVSDLQDQISNSNPKLLKSKRAGEIEKVILRLTEELLKQKIHEIGLVATQINRSIAHDERIDRIKIDISGKMSLFGRDGYETKVDLSAGQMQILIMSLVSALAEVAAYQAPFIIDTPLARLDEEHREGLFKHWSSLNQQVILLSQDTEITHAVYQRLEPHISQTYLVQAESLESAGARSHVVANAYFE